jgi:hypothetical protein
MGDITKEWLLSIGEQDGDSIIIEGLLWVCDGCWYLGLVKDEVTAIPRQPQTREDVRRLCNVLGLQLNGF